MKLEMENLPILTNLITLISSIVAAFNAFYKNYDATLYILITCICIMCFLSCFYWIKRYPIWKQYYFIRYLFFEIKENKFNIAPKVLLYSDLSNKKNTIKVKTLSVIYKLEEINGKIDSNTSWTLKEISNVKCNDFYLYAGIDLGQIQKPKFIVTCNNVPIPLDPLIDNTCDSENDIFLYHWDIPEDIIKDGKKIDKIEISMKQKAAFDFSRKEVIYFFPNNFAKKIDNVQFEIIYPMTLNKIAMQIWEAGKIKNNKFPSCHSIDTSSEAKLIKDNDNQTFSYKFTLKKQNINMENLYYILMQQIK